MGSFGEQQTGSGGLVKLLLFSIYFEKPSVQSNERMVQLL